ncbi:preprotein translocase subunit SecA [Patescibacteria group bacterium]|nr:preprotein translocase subunit SecA [Patescibacteria group bacterium]
MSFLSKIFSKDPNEKEINQLQPLVEAINVEEGNLEKLSLAELKKKSLGLQEKIKKGQSKEDFLVEAFALVRAVAQKTLGQRHFDVQLMGGIVLHQGKIAEMKTGEGKTLASTAPIYLNALEQKGVHVITVNDYLARRDTVWMGQIYRALGLKAACLVHDGAFLYDPEYIIDEEGKEQEQGSSRDQLRDATGSFKVEQTYLRPISRKEAYQADITYGTNNEFGFDYLRDNLVRDLKDCVQRELNYAIIDEVDSVLIDEARTPLIISAPDRASGQLYYKLANLVKSLKSEKDYVVDEKLRSVILTEEGMAQMASFLGEDPWVNNNTELAHHIDAALKALVLFQKDRDYVVQKEEIVIIDEFTGRLMPGRRYSEGLHQALEAKENVKVKQESKTLATITFQNYFRFYHKLAGMTGTAETEAEEFHKIYDLEVVVIPTNKPIIRQDLADRIYRTKEAKFKAIIEDVKERHQKGQPILIGTGGFTIGEKTVGAIEKNQIIKKLLDRQGVSCQVLDAKNHEKEGQVIAQAGRKGSVTVATNMAGRGVDIVLGGSPFDQEKYQEIIDLGGLHIIGSERHESRRIDNQLRGRAGRQGDPGSSQFFLSLEDDLMRIFGGSRLSGLMQTLKIPEDVPIESKIVSRSMESAQKKIEGFNFDTRKHLLEYDDILNKHRETIYRLRKRILEMDYSALRENFLAKTKEEVFRIIESKTREGKVDQEAVLKIMESIFPSSQEDFQEKVKPSFSASKMAEKIMEVVEKDFQQIEKEIKEKEKELGDKNLMSKILRSIHLQTIDRYWVYHLDIINNLKGGIGLRAYGQHDPLVEYKRESRQKFRDLLINIDQQIIYSVYKIGLVKNFAPRFSQPTINLGKKSAVSSQKKKVGRNDPCPCGSGKKYKKCCYPKYE